MKHAFLVAVALSLGMVQGERLSAEPMARHASPVQFQVSKPYQKDIDAEPTVEKKFAYITRAMKAEQNANARRQILEAALRIPGTEREKFLINVLATDEDSGLRSQAATGLGHFGSEKVLNLLADAARNDRTTMMLLGDVGGASSARRAATFAIAELATRFPRIADEAATKLRALPVIEDPKDNESLADARAQALYQITQDRALLTPFYARLRSKDARERERGIVAFQFFKVKSAPLEIVGALKDTNLDVRMWAALVLGGIGDPKTVPALMAVAENRAEDASVRCNALYSLGKMKTATAKDLLERLLSDPNAGVQSNAAIALYRITGRKVKQFPEGYRTD
ncbi:MAG: lyase domain protein repeat-containing protein [Chthonomonadales bacterium]|nr:lyase domain protein repeat-containing protein [Chthonomonadales bacterium]